MMRACTVTETGRKLKHATKGTNFLYKLCKAAICAVKAIREVEPAARMIHIDLLVQVVTPRDKPYQQPLADLIKVPCQEYIDELHRWQKELNRVTELDEDPFRDPVELQDVIDAAKRLKINPDKNWN